MLSHATLRIPRRGETIRADAGGPKATSRTAETEDEQAIAAAGLLLAVLRQGGFHGPGLERWTWPVRLRVLTVVSSRWAVSLVGLALLGMLVGGCSSGDDSEARNAEEVAAAEPGPWRDAMLRDTLPADCAVGKRPDYFVPDDDRRPALLVGCARLGVSRKRAEFSVNLGRIDGKAHLCVNPAYTGRGRPGFYIPAICKLNPPLARFAIRYAAQPRQGVRGYAFVIWGTARASTSDVVARFSGGTARAAVLKVRRRLARRFDGPPFSLFVLELPLRAACNPVTMREGGSNATERIPSRPRLCERA